MGPWSSGFVRCLIRSRDRFDRPFWGVEVESHNPGRGQKPQETGGPPTGFWT
jgi:hypothetical protein